MACYILIILFFLTSNLYCQDFSMYKQLIDEGKLEEIQKSLPYLISEYPEHPFILYLNAAVNSDGEQALEQFQAIVRDHPGTTACELSIMKVGEYLYSMGLYTQASEQLKIIPLSYPESNDIERAFNLMKKSYLATGEQDSIDLYIEIFSEKYPQLNFSDYNYYSSVVIQEDKPVSKEILDDSVESTEPDIEQVPIKLVEKPWVVQVGAFREKKNAETIMNRLESAGYNIEVISGSGEMNLFLVQIVRFGTIENAINIGEEVRAQFGIEFRIVERN